jgi:hypothetical protein
MKTLDVTRSIEQQCSQHWHRAVLVSLNTETFLAVFVVSQRWSNTLICTWVWIVVINLINMINYHKFWGIKAKPWWPIRCREQLQGVSSRVRIPVRSRDFFSKKYRPSLEVNYPHIQWAVGLFPRVNGPGSKIVHSLQYNADYRNKWSYTSIPPLGFHDLKCRFNSKHLLGKKSEWYFS